MNDKKKKLIRLAKQQYIDIRPCSDKESLNDCFTFYDNRIVFWFNTSGGYTHILVDKI